LLTFRKSLQALIHVNSPVIALQYFGGLGGYGPLSEQKEMQ
jgi:hypothetical protein